VPLPRAAGLLEGASSKPSSKYTHGSVMDEEEVPLAAGEKSRPTSTRRLFSQASASRRSNSHRSNSRPRTADSRPQVAPDQPQIAPDQLERGSDQLERGPWKEEAHEMDPRSLVLDSKWSEIHTQHGEEPELFA